jgi:hypothetical protein
VALAGAGRGGSRYRTTSGFGALGRRRALDRGSVTVELALALPALVILLLVMLWAVGLAGSSMACADAARAGARAAARGESTVVVAALVRGLAPAGATVATSRAGGTVSVRVVLRSRIPGPWQLPAVTLDSVALARLEAAAPIARAP